MPASPICLVSINGGSWQDTHAGVNIDPNVTIDIKLDDATDVTAWYLEVVGRDELSPLPTLAGVNPVTHLVDTPVTTVEFTSENASGRALVFQSTVNTSAGPTLVTRFALYLLTDHGLRVAATGETIEGDPTFGWGAIVNPVIRTAGGGGTLAGDVTGASSSNVLSAIRGVASPDSVDADVGKVISVVSTSAPDPFTTPRALVSDGTYLYVGESSTGTPVGTAIVHKMLPSGTSLHRVAYVDLSSVLGTVDRVRDLAQDSTYLYAACWDAENVAIINKATMTIAGWCYTGSGSRAISVDADDAGNVYVYQPNTPHAVQKFSVAACLGQPPGTIGPTASCSVLTSRWICYGGGKIWVVNGGSGGGSQKALRRIDAATMTQDGYINTLDGNQWTFDVIYAFGSVWINPFTTNICRINPVTLSVMTISPTGGFTGNTLNLGIGPDSSGIADAWIWISAGNDGEHNVGAIDPGTNTWVMTLDPSPSATSVYDSPAGVGSYVYFGGFLNGSSTEAIGYANPATPTAGECAFGVPRLAYTNVKSLQGRAVAATGPTNGQALIWNACTNQWEPGSSGSSITLGGDLFDWTPASSSLQRVVGIDTLPAPLSSTAADGKFVRVTSSNPWVSPRPMIRDGNVAWVAEHDQSTSTYPYVRKVRLPDFLVLATVDVSAYITPGTGETGIRDLAQDDNYVYCAGWWSGQVIIISKATNVVVGCGAVGDFGSSFRQITSVAADNAGNVYAIGWGYTSSKQYAVFQWTVADCLGHGPDEVLPTQQTVSGDYQYFRKIRYGSGALWIAGGFSGHTVLSKFNPTTLTEVAHASDTAFGMNVALYGGYVWVTDKDGPYLRKYDTSCNLIDSVLLGANQPDGIAFDDLGSGNVFITSSIYSQATMVDSGAMTVTWLNTTMPSDAFGEMITYNGAAYVTAFAYHETSVIGFYKITQSDVVTQVPDVMSLECSVIDSLQGRSLASKPPLSSQVITYNASLGQWEPSGKYPVFGRISQMADVQYNYQVAPPTAGKVPRVASNKTWPRGVLYDNRAGIWPDSSGPGFWICRATSGDVLWYDIYWGMQRSIPLTTVQAGFWAYGPEFIVSDAASGKLWVGGDRIITKIDITTQEVQATIQPELGISGATIAGLFCDTVSQMPYPPLNAVFAACATTVGRIYLIDPVTDAVTIMDISGVNEYCNGIYVMGGYVYYFGTAHIFVIHKDTWTLSTTIAYGYTLSGTIRFASPAAYSPTYLYFIAEGTNRFFRLTWSSFTLTSIALAGTANSICYESYEPACWVASSAGFLRVVYLTGSPSVSTTLTVPGTDVAHDIVYDPLYQFVWGALDGTGSYGAYICRWRPYASSGAVSQYENINGSIDWITPLAVTGSPSNGQTIVWNSSTGQWVPSNFTFGGRAVSTSVPTNGQVATWDSSQNMWVPSSPATVGIIGVTAGTALYTGQAVMLEQDRTGATTNMMAYPLSYVGTYTGIYVDSDATHLALSFRSGSPMIGVFEYDACVLTTTVGVIAYHEGHNLEVVPFTIVYNNSTGSYTKTLGTVATVYAGAGNLTHVCICPLDATRFVVACVDAGTAVFVAGTYAGLGAPVTYGTSVILKDGGSVNYTDIAAIAMAGMGYNTYPGDTTRSFYLAVGRTSTGRGYITMGSVYGTNSVSVSNLVGNDWFANGTGDFGGMTLRILGQPSTSLSDNIVGIMYGGKQRCVDVTQYYNHFLNTGPGYGTNWRVDSSLLDAATNEAGFGDFIDGGRFINVFKATVASTTRTCAVMGTARGAIPTVNQAASLPTDNTANWGLSAVTVRRLSPRMFAYVGLQLYNSTYPTKYRIWVGTGYVREGEVGLYPGLELGSGQSNYWYTHQLNSTQKYIRYPILHFGGNRFAVVASCLAHYDGATNVNAIFLNQTDDRELFYGIVQANASAGATASVAIVGGTSTCHTGLVPGAKYYLEKYGNAGNAPTNTGLVTLKNDFPVGVALSTTRLLLDPNFRGGHLHDPSSW